MKSLEKIFLKGLYKKFIILAVVHLISVSFATFPKDDFEGIQSLLHTLNFAFAATAPFFVFFF